MKEGLYIGLMSGTSIDGIDAVLVEFTQHQQRLIAHHAQSWPEVLQQRLRQLVQPGENEIEQLGALDVLVAEQFANATSQLIKLSGVSSESIIAIGSHGQTIRHRPNQATPFTLQIGDPNQIAEQTGITVVGDFRRRDMAAGGQGAPLVPAFHNELFRSPDETRVILNLGGIANITLLPGNPSADVIGFDTGPANTLLDLWARRHLQTTYDHNGDWSSSGTVNKKLLELLLSDDYFTLAPPKSTGTEYFNAHWLDQRLMKFTDLPPADVQATLCQLTVTTVANAIQQQAPKCKRIIACGGGVYNQTLMRELADTLNPIPLETTAMYGIEPEHVEATAFAWLAMRTLSQLSGNLPSVTGASHKVPLGGIYLAHCST